MRSLVYEQRCGRNECCHHRWRPCSRCTSSVQKAEEATFGETRTLLSTARAFRMVAGAPRGHDGTAT